MTRAIYADDFDPPTNAHMWVIREGAQLFAELVVAVTDTRRAASFLSVGKRKELLTRLTAAMDNVVVCTEGKNLSARLALKHGATHVLIRAATAAKFEREQRLSHLGEDLQLSVRTALLIPPPEPGRPDGRVRPGPAGAGRRAGAG